MRRIDWLVVHTAAAYDAKRQQVVHQSYEQIDNYHRSHNGWRMIGYHVFIEKDGTILPGRREEDLGAHVGGFNEHSLGICVSGHGDYEAFNPAQLSSLALRLVRWCRTYSLPAERCIGHREADEHGAPQVFKTCPGMLVDLNEIRRLVRDRLERGPSV